MKGLLIILPALLSTIALVIVIIIFYNISETRSTVTKMYRTLTNMAKSMGCIESRTPVDDGVDEEFMGYVVTSDVRKAAKEFLDAGVYTKAEAELCRAAHMPRAVASAYLEQL